MAPYLDRIFCPVRDCTLLGLVTNEMCLRWIVFVAEVILASKRDTDPESGKMAIAARRASNYQYMRQTIANSENWTRTSTVFGLSVASTAEYRAGDPSLERPLWHSWHRGWSRAGQWISMLKQSKLRSLALGTCKEATVDIKNREGV
jgi:hypothetical protein